MSATNTSQNVFQIVDSQYNTFLDAYIAILQNVLNAQEVCVRTLNTKELLGYSFSVKDTTKIFKLKEENRFSYLFAEILWYAAGSFDSAFIEKYASFWNKIQNADGTVNSNYGERIFRQQEIPPFFKAYNQLLRDKNSRQAIVHINLPDDINTVSKDIPCTLTLQFFIRNNAVHLLTSMRSSDVWKGITYDIPNFYVFLHTMWLFLKENAYPELKLGEYKHISGSMHIYDKDYERAQKFLAQQHELINFQLKKPLVSLTGQPTLEIEQIFKSIEKDGKSAYDVKTLYSEYFK